MTFRQYRGIYRCFEQLPNRKQIFPFALQIDFLETASDTLEELVALPCREKIGHINHTTNLQSRAQEESCAVVERDLDFKSKTWALHAISAT
jgi:hypothetical protein